MKVNYRVRALMDGRVHALDSILRIFHNDQCFNRWVHILRCWGIRYSRDEGYSCRCKHIQVPFLLDDHWKMDWACCSILCSSLNWKNWSICSYISWNSKQVSQIKALFWYSKQLNIKEIHVSSICCRRSDSSFWSSNRRSFILNWGHICFLHGFQSLERIFCICCYCV